MKNTTLKEYVFKLPMEEYNTIILVFYYGINILTGTPQKYLTVLHLIYL